MNKNEINSNNGSVDVKIKTEHLNDTNKEIYTYDEAVALTGNGKFHFLILFVSGSCLLGVITEGLNMGVVLPSAKCDLHFTTTEQGIINSVGFLGIVLSSHFWGFMADTWGRHKVLRIASGLGFLCSVISSFSISVWMLILTRFAVGVIISGVQAASLSYLGEFHCDKNRTRAVTFAAMFMTISINYMAIMGLIIIPMNWKFDLFGLVYRPWRLYILTSSFINAIAFIILLFLPESPKFLLAMKRKEDTIRILKNVYHINTGKPAETYPVKDVYLDVIGSNISDAHGIKDMGKLIWRQTWPLFKYPHLWHTLLLCYLMFILFMAAHGTFMWFPDILTTYFEYMTDEPRTICEGITVMALTNGTTTSGGAELDITDHCIASDNPITFQIILVNGTTFILIYIFVALNIDRMGRKPLLTIWLIISSLAAIGLVFASNFYVIIALITLFMSCGNCGSVISAISADLFPTNIKAMALCLILMSGRIGAVVGSNFVAALLQNQCNGMFYIYAGLLLSCVIICLFMSTSPKKK